MVAVAVPIASESCRGVARAESIGGLNWFVRIESERRVCVLYLFVQLSISDRSLQSMEVNVCRVIRYIDHKFGA